MGEAPATPMKSYARDHLTGLLLLALITAGCSSNADDARTRIEPEYDRAGRLQLLTYDSNGNGTPDTFSHMDGAKVIRIDIDKDEDGTVDRWEYYAADQKLAKVGFSRQADGVEDAWSYGDEAGRIVRIEVSTRRDGKVDRTEYFDGDRMVRAEDDTDGDGQIDKWATYEGPRLTSVAFDTTRRGTPDRRLTYGADGTAVMEIDSDGDGRFVLFDESHEQ